MNKKLILGALLPLTLVGASVCAFMLLKRPDPPKNPALGSDAASLLSVMPTASVQRVRALAEMSDTLSIQASGSVVPYREIQLAAEVAGKIIEKAPDVRGGNVVKKGQVLLKIDPRDYELDIERLNRRLDQELAALEELKLDISNAKRLVDVVEEEYALADGEVKRFQGLSPNVASAAELDQAKRARLTSANQRITLENQIRSLESKVSRLELATLLAETELDQAKLALERTVILSSVDGRIVSEEVEADSYVQRGTMLLTIEDTEKVEVSVNLRMDQLYWVLDQASLSADELLNAAQASRYTLPKTPVTIRYTLTGRESVRYEWQGHLDRYDGAGLDPQSRTVPVRILVEHPDRYLVNGQPADMSSRSGPPNLVRGMFVDVDIEAQPATQLLLVPKLSIKPATNSYQIWKFAADKRAFEVVRKRNSSPDTEDSSASANQSPTQVAEQQAAADLGNTSQIEIVPEEWEAGFLEVIGGIRVIGAFDPTFAMDAGPNAANLQATGQGPNNPPKTGDGQTHTSGDPSQTSASGIDQKNSSNKSATSTAPEQVEYWICEVTDRRLLPGDFVVVTPLPGIEGNGEDPIRVLVQEL